MALHRAPKADRKAAKAARKRGDVRGGRHASGSKQTFQARAGVGDMIITELHDVNTPTSAGDDDDLDLDVTGLGDDGVADAWGQEAELRAAARARKAAERTEADRAARANETRAERQEREIADLREVADKRSREDVAEARRVLREKNVLDEIARIGEVDAAQAQRIRDARDVQLRAEMIEGSGGKVDELAWAIREMDVASGFTVPGEEPGESTAVVFTAAQLEAHLLWRAEGSPAPETEPDAEVVVEAPVELGEEPISEPVVDADAESDGFTETVDEPDVEAAEPVADINGETAAEHDDFDFAGPWFDESPTEPASDAAGDEPAVADEPEIDVAAPDFTFEFPDVADELEQHGVVEEQHVAVEDYYVIDPEVEVVDSDVEFDVAPVDAPDFDIVLAGVETDFTFEPEETLTHADEDEAPETPVIFDDEPADGHPEPLTDPEPGTDVSIVDIDLDDVYATPADDPDDAVILAEIVEESIAPALEVAIDAPEVVEAAPEVHIHHHYAAEPAAPQIIYVEPKAVPEAVPAAYQTQAAAAPPRAPERRPQPAPERPSKKQRIDVHNEYADAPPPFIEMRPDSGPFVPLEHLPPAPKVKEPLFMWRGQPIGGTKLSPEERIAAKQSSMGPRAQSPSTPGARGGFINRRYVSSGVNPQAWFDDTVQECLELGVSDLHIRVEADSQVGDRLEARIRVDGRLRPFQTIEGLDATTIINRFKTHTGLSTSGNFVPEEGVYPVPIGDEERKARVALFRTAKGGDALVLRLPPTGALRSLEELEFSAQNLDLFHSLLSSANRMILMAGPMGSGKTTTVHGALLQVATPDRSVWSIEDPVERDIPGLIQLEVDEDNGAGFDALLPVLVRSDYDTLFLGEIRDKATASAGVRQAKAGRQVLTTIHATDNVMALKRLIELSSDTPMSVLDSVLGVVSQRLVRKLNPEWDGWTPETKYRGRAPIHEVLRLNDQLIEALAGDSTISEQKRVAAEASESTFAGDSKRLVEAGITDWDEINRVLGM